MYVVTCIDKIKVNFSMELEIEITKVKAVTQNIFKCLQNNRNENGVFVGNGTCRKCCHYGFAKHPVCEPCASFRKFDLKLP